jgi:hypothetical protein
MTTDLTEVGQFSFFRLQLSGATEGPMSAASLVPSDRYLGWRAAGRFVSVTVSFTHSTLDSIRNLSGLSLMVDR